MVRFKNRYLLVEVNPEKPILNYEPYKINPDTLYRAVIKKVQQLHGDFGVAAVKSGFLAKYCNPQLRIALFRARHGPHKIVASSLPFVDLIDGKKIVMRSLYTGATIRNCFKFLIKYQQQKIYTNLDKLKGTPNYEKLCQEFMDVSKIKAMN
ncbi:POP5 ribonuclease P/MRP subunit [Carabus blaptoides fortunei]